MQNIWLVIKYEITTTITKRSFWFTTIIFPGLILFMNIGLQFFARSSVEQRAPGSPFEALQPGSSASGESEQPALVYVDHAQMISKEPAGLPPGTLQSFRSEAEAQAALQAGQIAQYYIIPPDYIETGQLIQVNAEFSPFSGGEDLLFSYILNYNLVEDEALAALLLNPTPQITPISLAPEGVRDESNPVIAMAPFAVMFILFFLITIMSSFMLVSVSREKENHTAEILLLSIRPRQLMLGKLLGLSVVALIQVTIWIGGSLLLLTRGQDLMGIVSGLSLPPGFLLWTVLYFMLGFLTYGALMGMIGVLAPSAREGNQFTILVLLPLLLPVWVNAALIQSPNSLLAVLLSFIPFTSPTTMVMRMVATQVPVWQPIVSLLLLAVTTYGITLVSARFFRADTLLSSAELKWQRLVAEFKHSRG